MFSCVYSSNGLELSLSLSIINDMVSLNLDSNCLGILCYSHETCISLELIFELYDIL
jgi:hypothetical protein